MSDRNKALEAALSQIDKQFGKGSAMKFGQRPVVDVEVIPSGSLCSRCCTWCRWISKRQNS